MPLEVEFLKIYWNIQVIEVFICAVVVLHLELLFNGVGWGGGGGLVGGVLVGRGGGYWWGPPRPTSTPHPTSTPPGGDFQPLYVFVRDEL